MSASVPSSTVHLHTYIHTKTRKNKTYVQRRQNPLRHQLGQRVGAPAARQHLGRVPEPRLLDGRERRRRRRRGRRRWWKYGRRGREGGGAVPRGGAGRGGWGGGCSFMFAFLCDDVGVASRRVWSNPGRQMYPMAATLPPPPGRRPMRAAAATAAPPRHRPGWHRTRRASPRRSPAISGWDMYRSVNRIRLVSSRHPTRAIQSKHTCVRGGETTSTSPSSSTITIASSPPPPAASAAPPEPSRSFAAGRRGETVWVCSWNMRRHRWGRK